MMPRDISVMVRDGRCVVCGLDLAPEDTDPSLDMMFAHLHIHTHVRDGTAVVEMAYGKVDRVVPTSSLPVKDTADDPNPKVTLPRTARSVYRKSFRP